ncbi:MAG: M15 family metallopeptidase [Bacteroidales bacterium]|nr:M15 family metallopeptidase [Bacteroidales bacterium]
MLLLFILSATMYLTTSATLATPSFAPGEVVPERFITTDNLNDFFTCTEIPDDIFNLMQGRSFKANCVVPRSELRYIRVLHKNAHGESVVGEMTLHQSIATEVLSILKELYQASYPIERMRLIDYYEADDEQSMRANNSSGFNFRYISHTTKVSVHGHGKAVDINPLYNPYHKVLKDGREVIEPANGAAYLKRDKVFPYKITKEDLCCRLFKKHGFVWGGDWVNSKDYQHFEKP